MKKTYDFDSIYFGSLVFNTGSDGYYHSTPIALRKVEQNLYKSLNRDIEIKPYKAGTDEFLTVTNLVPLSSLTDNKGNETISESKITLHLLKYRLNSKNREVMLYKSAKENYDRQYSKKKNK